MLGISKIAFSLTYSFKSIPNDNNSPQTNDSHILIEKNYEVFPNIFAAVILLSLFYSL